MGSAGLGRRTFLTQNVTGMRDKLGRFTKGKSEVIGQIREKIRGKNNPNWKEKVCKKCEVCGISFEVHPCRTKTAVTCSYKCRAIYVGRIVTDDSKPNWKGGDVSYAGLHQWVYRKLGEPLRCTKCNKARTTSRSIQWANISHKYKRTLTDWVPLCVSCHKKYDLEYLKSI